MQVPEGSAILMPVPVGPAFELFRTLQHRGVDLVLAGKGSGSKNMLPQEEIRK